VIRNVCAERLRASVRAGFPVSSRGDDDDDAWAANKTCFYRLIWTQKSGQIIGLMKSSGNDKGGLYKGSTFGACCYTTRPTSIVCNVDACNVLSVDGSSSHSGMNTHLAVRCMGLTPPGRYAQYSIQLLSSLGFGDCAVTAISDKWYRLRPPFHYSKYVQGRWIRVYHYSRQKKTTNHDWLRF
jgi:hypothetical protein